jgi:phosphoribosylformylglycinamidine (FGAM) synthase-like enzyme
VQSNQTDSFEFITRDTPRALVGDVTEERHFLVYGLKGERVVDVELDELMNAWKRGLEADT